MLSQAFEGTGVRAYKGQAPKRVDKDPLTATLQIHSVEARNAAEVRRLPAASQGASLINPWIAGNESGAAADALYAREDNATQAEIDQHCLGTYSQADVTQVYDEPLTIDAVVGKMGLPHRSLPEVPGTDALKNQLRPLI